MAKLTKKGYGTIELNLVAAKKTGQIKAQYPLADDNFPAATAPAENGMLLVVDEINGVVDLPTANTDYVYLHASPESVYNHLTPGNKNFYLANEGDEFYPRMYKLSVGDVFTTNTVEINSQTPAVGMYAYAGTDGYITLAAAQIATEDTLTIEEADTDVLIPTAQVELRIKKITTMPDGQVGYRFVVTRA